MIATDFLESLIEDKKFILDWTFTICVITLKNWFKVVWTSALLKQEDFDKEIWEQIAYEEAFNKLWELEAYKQK